MADPSALAVGVTGHRNPHPRAMAALCAEVVRAFERLETEIGSRIVVLSSLAEGADRIVAEIALQRGHQLIAVLPLPTGEYEKDFADDVSRAEFHSFLARAHSCRVTPLPPGEDVTTSQGRAAAYRSAGLDVARDCLVLLALWDGHDTGKPGGTWDIARFKLASGGVVVRIHTSRAPEREPAAVTTDWPDPHEEAWQRLIASRRVSPAAP
jgi:hypothetical protein